MSSSVIPLLITSRNRWLPASGAKVKPDFRTRLTASASPTLKASARNDGRLTLTPLSTIARLILSVSSSEREWSAVDRDRSDTSCQPECLIP